jgi:AAA lid domain
VNPGLSRRFSTENAFEFEDYDDDELLSALELKLKKQDLTATDEAKRVAIETLSRARNRPNFGNIGEVENRLSQAKINIQSRNAHPDAPLEPEDFDPDYKRSENAAENLSKLFEGTVACEDIVEKLAHYQKLAAGCKLRDMDPRELVPTTFIFKGPPGE